MLNEFGYKGTQNPDSTSGEFNALTFVISQLINRISTATPVKVVAVTNDGGLSPVGFVDIQPLITQLDGYGNAVPHGIIHGCPYFRLQGGGNAVILDPEIGDIGIAIFADKDITSVIANRAESTPGSFRRFSMADGMYIGGLLNDVPSQYVQFSADGIKIHSPTKINLDAPDIQLNADTIELNASSKLTMTSPVIEMNASTSIKATTPLFTITGNLVTQGSITGQTGMQISGTYPGGAYSAIFAGAMQWNAVTITATGQMSFNGKRIDDTLRVSGVQPGAGNSGTPI